MDCWDEQVAKVMFGYRCGIHASTKFSLFMIMIGCTPHLRVDNYQHSLANAIDDTLDAEIPATQFLQKMKLIANIHENVIQCRTNTKKSKEDLCY
jgi:hypothetical protein